ncbi:hypothetical protein IKF03_00330 [Candidatus Saccharibacteria bacterium]|nr:hypothetical protein [Candidatus Saccharibacteria bacterium]
MGKLNLSNLQERANKFSKDITKKSQSFSDKIKEAQKSQKSKGEARRVTKPNLSSPKNTNLKKLKDIKKRYFIIGLAIMLLVVFLLALGSGGNKADDVEETCRKAIEEGDYSTFYREACSGGRSKYTKDDFISACEGSGKKFYDNPNSSSDECLSESEYNSRVEADKKAEEEKQRKKAECEASDGKWDGYSCKSKEELEAEKKAEEERKAKEEAEKRAEAEQKAKEEAEKRAAEEKSKQENQQSQQQSTPAPQPTTNTPSIDEIADACWLYGQTWGVPLTDYASTTITKEDNYYRILMWERGGKSTWKCWYNPDNKDVFVEKTR